MDTLGSSVPNAASEAESTAAVTQSSSSREPEPDAAESRTGAPISMGTPISMGAPIKPLGPPEASVTTTEDRPDREATEPSGIEESPEIQETPPPFLLANPAESADVATARPAVFTLAETLEADPPERPENLVAVIESLLFVAEEAPSVRHLAEATNVSKDAVEEALEVIEASAPERGLHIQRHGSTVRLVSAPASAQWVQRFLGLERPNKLSKAALETLAIIVYRQPVTRSDVEKIRGVGCDGPFHTLRLRELIEPIGQTDAPGRPHLWGVTQYFLDHFGLKGLDELPPLPGANPATQGQLSLDRVPEPASLDADDAEGADARSAQPPAERPDRPVTDDPAAEEGAAAGDTLEQLGEFAAAGGSGA